MAKRILFDVRFRAAKTENMNRYVISLYRI